MSTMAAVAVKERPILFSAPMVRANLEDRKTKTRRLIKPQPEHLQVHDYKGKRLYDGEHRMWCWKRLVLENIWDFPGNDDRKELAAECPYGKPGDRLWVRENLIRPDGDPWLYAADNEPVMVDREDETAMLVWAHHKEQDYCHSIHMPRWASRDTLEITDVRVERLQDISEADAIAEGMRPMESGVFVGREGPGRLVTPWPTAREAYADLWESINGKGSWDLNRWVWVISYKRIGGVS